MPTYLDFMHNFTQAQLKKHLGNQLIETLIEWSPNGDALLTKQRLITMIDCIYGSTIFTKRDFRKDLLLSMTEKDILDIRDACLSKTERLENDARKLAEIISEKTWGNNEISRYLLRKWGVDENILISEREISNPIETVSSSHSRFFELLDYQYYIKQRALNYLNSGNLQERMFIHMPTGTGKTKTSMHTIVNYMTLPERKEGLIIWIAHTNELLLQAYDTFVEVWSHLGDGDCTVYKLWGSNNILDLSRPLNGIAFCGLSKLMSIYDNNLDLFNRLKTDCRLVVFDEAHKASANKTKEVIESLMRMPAGYANRALIGLSATPGRTTEASYSNSDLSNMFGNKLIYIDSSVINQINLGRIAALNASSEKRVIKYFQDRKILSRITPKRLQYQSSFTESELRVLSEDLENLGFEESDYSEKQLRIFAENKNRNLVIMQELRTLVNQKIPTIVFACSVPHAKMLSAMLTLEGIKNSLVVGDMNAIDRKKAIDSFKRKDSDIYVIINYEVLTTGFDSKNIKCVFITRPTKSVVLYSQMLGRGLRGPMMGGNEDCLLIDVEDNLTAFNNESAFSHFNDYWKV